MEKERRIKVLAIVVLVIAVIGLSVAFAALSQTLTINGSAKLDASKWGLKFDNLVLASVPNPDYIEGTATIKTDDNTVIENMNVRLTTPGDKVVYTVDLVNEGTINAKIDKIIKTALTTEQEKYLSFKVLKENNEELNEGYVLGKETRIPLRIEIEFKKDITKEDLPKETSTITLSYALTFVQTDEKEIVGGGQGTITSACTTFDKKDTYNVGDEIALCNNDTNKSEDFYVISDNGDTVTALAKYNLLIGNEVVWPDLNFGEYTSLTPIDSSTTGYGLQNSSARGAVLDNTVWTGTIAFAENKVNNNNGYWVDSNRQLLSKYGTSYPAYVFDENSLLYEPLKNYESYIKTTLGKTSVNTSLLSYEQATSLGCDKASETYQNAPNWVYSTTYWLGSADGDYHVWGVSSNGYFTCYVDFYDHYYNLGLRPVITIAKTDL